MVRRRGTPRRSAPRRRTYRVKLKWDPHAMPVRFKLLLPYMVEELDWELEVLLLLEEDVYPYLEDQGIPTEEWEYYVAFAKRIWERKVHFNYLTFTLEKTSLVNEFTLRGLDPLHLGILQGYAEDRAEQKITGLAPVPRPVWTYDNMVAGISLADSSGGNGGYYDNRF